MYQDRMEILQSIPGIRIISAMELLLELQDVSRFRRAEQLAAYVGLTPSQYSSADKVRMARRAWSIFHMQVCCFFAPVFISVLSLKFDDRVCFANNWKPLLGTPAFFHNNQKHSRP